MKEKKEKNIEKSKEQQNIRLKFFGFPKIMPYLKPYRRTIILMITFGVIVSFIDAIFPLFDRYALDNFVMERTVSGIWTFVAVYMAVLAFQVFLNFISTFWCGKMEMTVDRDLRNAAFNHLQTLSFSYFNQNSVGYIHARVMSDTGKIGEMVAWRMMDIVWNGSYLVGMLVIMLAVNARLALLLFLLIPVAVLIIIYFQKHLVVLNRKIREINSKITGNFNEGITGARTIKTLTVEDHMNGLFRRDTESMRSVSVRTAHYAALFASTISLMSSFALAIVLWKGGQLTMDGLIRIGTLSVFMSYALSMLDPIRNIVNTIAALIGVQVNVERLMKLLATKSDVADTPEVIAKYGDTFNPIKENWEPLHGDVEFRDVSFTYPDGEEEVLSHFSLKVPQGTNVAIVGETGAGKSTLVNLVCRFFEPNSGEILIDGRDARERSQLWLHSNIGYVLQTPHLFSGSVRDNLRYGKPDATDEEIMRALELVSADVIVARMDCGLDSDVGECGDLLSTGEKQLISFARAIICDPAILVLDEATSSIDTVTEKAIQDAIKVVTAGRTSFVIAHRLSTITDSDVILAVMDGKIIEQGTHRELIEKRGYYYELYTRQYEDLAADMV
mgnify:FL=1|jgi:ATP-binding cassette subfamily B protein